MPYAAHTSVSVKQSRADIESVLAKFGASSFGFAVEPGRAMVTFSTKGRRVRFVLIVPQGDTPKIQQLQRARWRALLLTVKSKLVSVESQIETFEEAFLAHIVTDDGTTIFERMKGTLLALPAPEARQ